MMSITERLLSREKFTTNKINAQSCEIIYSLFQTKNIKYIH